MRSREQAKIRAAKWRDRIARWGITLGGNAVILGVLVIVVLIVGVTFPLFRSAQTREVAHMPLPEEIRAEQVLAVGVESQLAEDANARGAGFLLVQDGTLVLLDFASGKLVQRETLPAPNGAPGLSIVSVEQQAGSRLSLLWSDGSASLIEVNVTQKPSSEGTPRGPWELAVQTLGEMPAIPGASVKLAAMRKAREGGLVCVRVLQDNHIAITRQVVEENLLGEQQTKAIESLIEEGIPGQVTAISLDGEGQTLYASTDNGCLVRWTLVDETIPTGEVVPLFRDRRRITSLAMVLGDVSIAVGDAQGEVWIASPVRNGTGTSLGLVHALGSHAAQVAALLGSERTRAILSLGQNGSIHLDYPTNERRLVSLAAPPGARWEKIGYSRRADAAVALDEQGKLTDWQIDCPHPEISWKSLFGKVSYEGYPEPTYAWQTTGGTEFEPKLSLVPLLFGTVKGTLYAMLLAMPLALLGAAYTSQFTSPRFRNTIKPVVEMMAAVPSVVIGFLIALWLAPLLERWVLAVFLSMLSLPWVFVLFMTLWQLLRRYDWAKRLENGSEFLLMVPVLLGGAGLAVLVTPFVETWLFAGNFQLWLYETLHARLDQRNSLIIAFGLGFAVIPIIFSIAEDSLSTVPRSLTAASMALGASRWQTLWRVILPSGSPGIFAGTMIGFGRAVGETMIVLMATGNTPILDWSPLNGMRTLSANIAVEIPEAPVGGTLYRVLFLCAVVLFLLTFLLNTLAELVRQRLRQRYGRL